MNLLEVRKVSRNEGGSAVLSNISFFQTARMNVAVTGESGAGKTTLLKIIAGLLQPDQGEVLFQNQKVVGPSGQLIPGHPSIGYLSQHFDLRNHYRVEEILEYGNKLPVAQAHKLYELCRIGHLLRRWTHQLSGGERQRIALAGLLSTAPVLVLLDEPFSNLDTGHKEMLKKVIYDLGENLSTTFLLSSHDPADMLSWAHQILVLKNGKLLQQGIPEDIYRFPADCYTAGLFGHFNELSPSIKSTLGYSDTFRKHSVIRPADLMIVNHPNRAIQGIVKQSGYFGSYYEVEVQLPDTVIFVHSKEIKTKGEQVFVALSNPSDDE